MVNDVKGIIFRFLNRHQLMKDLLTHVNMDTVYSYKILWITWETQGIVAWFNRPVHIKIRRFDRDFLCFLRVRMIHSHN